MRQILQLLEKDSWTSPEQIATMLGRPVAEVEQAIRDGEAKRVIVRYKTIINAPLSPQALQGGRRNPRE